MPTSIVEAFSLTHVAVLDGATGLDSLLDEGDLYGVNSASLELDSDSFDNTGDDVILSTWNWANRVNLAVQGGFLSLKNIARLSGSTTKSSGAGAGQTFSLQLWEQNRMNPAPVPVLVRMPSRDSDGTPRTLDIILYKVQFGPISFDGPAYKDGLKVNYAGQALFSDYDEAGNPVLDSTSGTPTKAIGRLLSRDVV